MNSKFSFTLIEILIVSAILVLFSGYILANYNNFNQVKNLEKEVNRLVDVLSLNKSKAQAADINFICSGTDEFGGYRVEVNDNDYNFRQCCRDISTKSISVCAPVIHTYSLANGIINISGTTQIDFYPLSDGALASTITLKNTVLEKCSDISVSSTGVINITDPQPC